MYERSTAGHRRSVYGSRKKPARGQENIRLTQLAVCLTLFLVIFLGKGIFPQKLGQTREKLLSLISTDLDFREALSELGASLPDGGQVLSSLSGFYKDAFGVEEPEEEPEQPAALQPPRPAGILDAERDFLGQRPDPAERTSHYARLSSFGLELTAPAAEPAPEEDPPAGPAAEPEAPPAVPAAGTVIGVSNYSGPALPENYTMDQLSLGDLETVTPVLGHLNSGFGYRDHPINGENAIHSGVDIGGQQGDPIAAFASGTVEYIGENDDYGLYLQLDHGSGIKSFYAHCSKVEVSKGQAVSIGETIARIGSTGGATGPHLHFELKYHKTRLDPAYYVEFLEQ